MTADDYMLLKFEALDESGTLIMSTAVLEYRINPGFTRAQLLVFPKGVPVVDMRRKWTYHIREPQVLAGR